MNNCEICIFEFFYINFLKYFISGGKKEKLFPILTKNLK